MKLVVSVLAIEGILTAKNSFIDKYATMEVFHKADLGWSRAFRFLQLFLNTNSLIEQVFRPMGKWGVGRCVVLVVSKYGQNQQATT